MDRGMDTLRHRARADDREASMLDDKSKALPDMAPTTSHVAVENEEEAMREAMLTSIDANTTDSEAETSAHFGQPGKEHEKAKKSRGAWNALKSKGFSKNAAAVCRILQYATT